MSSRVTDLSVQEQNSSIEHRRRKCQEIIDSEDSDTRGESCPTVWDQMACWPSTPAGTTAVQRCPDYIHNFLYDANATKTCEPNGTWYVNPNTTKRWTNYTQCIGPQQEEQSLEKVYFQRHVVPLRRITLVGYSLSLAALLLAILIMLKFKKLRCARNTLHLNLFVSFVWRAVVSLSRTLLFVDGSQLFDVVVVGGSSNEPTWQCRLFAVVFNFGMFSNYSWIFVEGCYLHTLIFAAFISETSGVHAFVLFGWAFPAVCVASWAVVRLTVENTKCWFTHTISWSVWMLKGPLLVTVLLNFFFFVNIIRVLFTKLQSINGVDSRKHRHIKLAKSSLVLIPLFGVPYIVFLALNENACPTMELLKLYFEMTFNSFNGLIVACLYCFLNGEVKAELAKKWRKATTSSRTTRNLSQKKTTTLTRSLNSNVQGLAHSNTYDTTDTRGEDEEEEDDHVEKEKERGGGGGGGGGSEGGKKKKEGWMDDSRERDAAKGKGRTSKRHVKKSNSFEMRVVNRFPTREMSVRGRSENFSIAESSEEAADKSFVPSGGRSANSTDEDDRVVEQLVPKIFVSEESKLTGVSLSQNLNSELEDRETREKIGDRLSFGERTKVDPLAVL